MTKIKQPEDLMAKPKALLRPTSPTITNIQRLMDYLDKRAKESPNLNETAASLGVAFAILTDSHVWPKVEKYLDEMAGYDG